MKYPTTSAYATTPQTSNFIGLYSQRNITPHKSDAIIKISTKYDMRPDLLSYDLYGDPSYWWIFVVRNPNILRDPIWDFREGVSIRVPSEDHLKSVIG